MPQVNHSFFGDFSSEALDCDSQHFVLACQSLLQLSFSLGCRNGQFLLSKQTFNVLVDRTMLELLKFAINLRGLQMGFKSE